MCNYLMLDLIKKFRNEDNTVFFEIYNEFEKIISVYSARLGGEDTVQELTVFLIELLCEIDLQKFEADSSNGLCGYIAVSIKNKYIELSKKRQQESKIHISYDKIDNFLLFATDEYFGISEPLKYLSPRQQLIITYKYIYNYTDCEISSVLGISRQAVNRLKNRAIKILKEIYYN